MAKKSELEADRDAYRAIMPQVAMAIERGAYQEAIDLAKSSWPYIDGMMQYERKYEEREFKSVETIDVVLRYAPLLLDFQSLNALEALLDERRRIDRDASDDLAGRLAKAKAVLWDAHRLWSYLEKHPGTRQDELRGAIGGDQDRWRFFGEAWGKMGLVSRAPEAGSYRLTPATRMDEVISAKCPTCGGITEGPKAEFLNELGCLKCRTVVFYVILSSGNQG